MGLRIGGDFMAKAPATATRANSSGGRFERVALVLQGGGALGSYQAGVFEALHVHGLEPDWVAGISIGAIYCALIAGNAPDHRVEKLHEFWNTVTAPAEQDWLGTWAKAWQGDDVRRLKNQLNAGRAMSTGVPGFYKPRIPPPFLQPSGAPGASSYYDTSDLMLTLERLVDFDRINHEKSMRFSVGAVNVRTGNFAYFDNDRRSATARHVGGSQRRPAASLRGRRDRWRILLGRRDRLEHPAAVGSAELSNSGYPDVSGGPLECARRNSGRSR